MLLNPCMALFHKMLKFFVPAEQLMQQRRAAKPADTVQRQTRHRSREDRQDECENQVELALPRQHPDARHDDARRKARQIQVFTITDDQNKQIAILGEKLQKSLEGHVYTMLSLLITSYYSKAPPCLQGYAAEVQKEFTMS